MFFITGVTHQGREQCQAFATRQGGNVATYCHDPLLGCGGASICEAQLRGGRLQVDDQAQQGVCPIRRQAAVSFGLVAAFCAADDCNRRRVGHRLLGIAVGFESSRVADR